MRIALATDAWTPQINGVVTTLKATAAHLNALGHEVRVIHPQGLRCLPCPSYPEIRLAICPGAHVARELKAFAPHAIHVATEGPLGMAVRRYCRTRGVAVHHLLPHALPGVSAGPLADPAALSYAWLRRFHDGAARTFVSSATPRVAARRARLRAPAPLARAGWTSSAFAPGPPRIRASRACRGRSWPASDGWQWRRTWTPSSGSRCRARGS